MKLRIKREKNFAAIPKVPTSIPKVPTAISKIANPIAPNMATATKNSIQHANLNLKMQSQAHRANMNNMMMIRANTRAQTQHYVQTMKKTMLDKRLLGQRMQIDAMKKNAVAKNLVSLKNAETAAKSKILTRSIKANRSSLVKPVPM